MALPSASADPFIDDPRSRAGHLADLGAEDDDALELLLLPDAVSDNVQEAVEEQAVLRLQNWLEQRGKQLTRAQVWA